MVRKTNVTIAGAGVGLTRLHTDVDGDVGDVRRHLTLIESTGCTITGITIEGPNTYRGGSSDGGITTGYSEIGPLFAQHGISLFGCIGTTINAVHVDSVYGDGLFVGGVEYNASDGVTVTGLSVDGAGRHGIALVRAANVSIDGFTTAAVGSTGIDLEPNSVGDYVTNVEMQNFTLAARSIPISAGGVYDVSDINIHDGLVSNGFVGRESVVVSGSAGTRYRWALANITRTYGGGFDHVVIFDDVEDASVTGFDCSTMPVHPKYTDGVGFVDCAGVLSVANSDWGGAEGPFLATGTTGAVMSSGNTWNSGASSD